jgi:hypothetical protein
MQLILRARRGRTKREHCFARRLLMYSNMVEMTNIANCDCLRARAVWVEDLQVVSLASRHQP